jgi:hypothetical protein
MEMQIIGLTIQSGIRAHMTSIARKEALVHYCSFKFQMQSTGASLFRVHVNFRYPLNLKLIS